MLFSFILLSILLFRFLTIQNYRLHLFEGGSLPSSWGVQRGLPLALLGNFQRCLQCGSENSLISYGIFYVNTLRCAVCLPVCLSAMAVPAVCFPVTPTLFFPFGRWVAGRSFPFSKALLHGAVGYKVFPINTLAAKREEDL